MIVPQFKTGMPVRQPQHTPSSASRAFPLAAIVLILSIAACAPAHDTEADARQLFKQYFTAIAAKDYRTAAALYPADEQAKWQDFLQQAEQEKGAMKSYTVDDVAADTVFRGKFYVFTVHAQNEKYNTTELITLFKKLDEDRMHVVAHKIERSRL